MYEEYLSKFSSKHIAVIGDIMLDKYVFGKVDRISQEAPIPVVQAQNEKYVLGGAANVATNIMTLTGNAYLFGVLGNDMKKDIFIKIAKDNNINTEGIVVDDKRPTTEKTRVIINKQQLARIDFESTAYLDQSTNEKIYYNLSKMKKLDMIILSDYAKGVISHALVKKIMSLAKKKNIGLIVDPKPKHQLFYIGAGLVTPNKKEAGEMCNTILETKGDINNAGKKIMETLGSSVIITLGESGMALFEKNRKPVYIPTIAKEVFDVSGAGDTAIAAVGLAICSGASLKDAAILSNIAAGIKVTKHGTAPVSLAELTMHLKNAK